MENQLLLMVLCSLFITSILWIFKPKKIIDLLKTIPRDLRLSWVFIRLQCLLWLWDYRDLTVPKHFRKIVRKNGNRVAFRFESQNWTFQEVDTFSNAIGHYFKALGYKKGDSIALLMDNNPEYVCIWLGLAKIGVITALINTNLKTSETLAHAIQSGKAKSIIFGTKFKSVVQSTLTIIPELKYFQFNDDKTEDDILFGASDLKTDLLKIPNDSLDKDINEGSSDDLLIFIYTSGTTGLPKASKIKNSRFMMAYLFFNLCISINREDVLYIPLPLYHSLGGMIGILQCLIGGTTVVIKRKFSASSFWKDCESYKCTIAQYIGEMARYVLLANKNLEKGVNYYLPKMFGNGMKTSTWKQFIKEFDIGQIYEFYGSTEGNFGLFNLDNTVGACGYIPLMIKNFCPIDLIKCTPTGEPIRDEENLCKTTPNGESGLLICKITNLISATKFDGYSDEKSTNSKILKNVFKNGDKYFNTGDILSRDSLGYYYFKDRTGDTFRWKGENVSTAEVEGILANLTKDDVAVYGVEIPGNEGKACMAALVDSNNDINLKNFLQECRSHLPSYSIPLFIRFVDKIPQTGTFKVQKTNLQKDGFDISLINDRIFFLDMKEKEYVLLNSNIYNKIVHSEIKI